MRIALGVEYDGSGFHGWQRQAGVVSLQGALEGALTRIADAPVTVTCAGRTDAGVHATAQVVHFDAPSERSRDAWVRGTNSGLPSAMAVTWMQAVPDAFHARFDALARCYTYLLRNEPVRPALAAGRAGWFHRPLDVARMMQAASGIVGEHDFSAFRSSECQARNPVRHVRRCAISRRDGWIVFEFEANAFLHHMVRNLVGSLVYVGAGRWPVERMAEVLAAGDRRLAAPTFAPDGLYLSGVDYDARWGLPGGGRVRGRIPLKSGGMEE